MKRMLSALILLALLSQQANANEKFVLESLMNSKGPDSLPAKILALLKVKEKVDLNNCQKRRHYKKAEMNDFFGAVAINLNDDGENDYLIYPKKFCENMFGAHAIPYWVALSSSSGYKIVRKGTTDVVTILDSKTNGAKDILEIYGVFQDKTRLVFTGKEYKSAE